MDRAHRLLAAALAATVPFLAAAPAVAVPRAPDDLTWDRDALGTAFVDSWLAFRRELDSLAHLPVHPALLPAWFDGAPAFLLRDALALAAEPRVAVAAARALARRADDRDRERLAAVEARHRSEPLANEIRAVRILAGDARALAAARADLSDPRAVVRERAAFALASAGRREGLSALGEMATDRSRPSRFAVRALGLLGAEAEDRLLRGILRDRGDDGDVLAARGEIALRRVFPHHHRALADRDCAATRLRVAGGLYDAWLGAIGGAVEGGARTSDAVIVHVEAVRRAATGDDGEVVRRNLAALTDFWRLVDMRLAATGAGPAWPRSMDAALALVREPRRADEAPARTAERISAVVAACAWSGNALGHGDPADDPAGAGALTPGGARALDGNLATAAHLARGGTLVLDLPAGAKPRELLIANSCADGAGPRLRRVAIAVPGGSSRAVLEAPLRGATRYFQRVPLNGAPASRLEIRALEIDGDGPACLAELRVR